MIYWQLFALFGSASLLAFGGALGMLPAITDTVVNEYHWMSANAVIRTYVLGQFVPGPNMVMATLIGFHVAGTVGALTSSVGMYLGPVTVTSFVTGLYYRNRHRGSVRRMETALRPLALGLVAAATLRFLRDEMQSNFGAGLLVSLPVVWLHWRGHLNAIAGVLLIGAGWYLIA